jgi:septin family protein
MNESMFNLADQLKMLREMKETYERELKAVNAEIEKVDYELSELMAETETQNFTRSGVMFSLKKVVRASAVAGIRGELFTALRSHGYGDLVTEQVNANSLSSFVKEQMENYAEEHEGVKRIPDWLEGKVNVFEKASVSVRKTK